MCYQFGASACGEQAPAGVEPLYTRLGKAVPYIRLGLFGRTGATACLGVSVPAQGTVRMRRLRLTVDSGRIMVPVTIVVPCFNEANRLPADRLRSFVARVPDVRFLLVNDGSTDGTRTILQALERENAARFSCIDLQTNRGKAEAVRIGMLGAFDSGAIFAGYWDADLATPLEEIPRFLDVLERMPERQVVFGARVQLLGRSIRRRALRHYLGRVFATVASETLRLPIYDTQCGAKLFRAGDATRSVFSEPFVSTWIFDVEIVARLMFQAGGDGRRRAEDVIYELPLDQWHDVGDSKVRTVDFGRGMLDLLRIYRRYLRRR